MQLIDSYTTPGNAEQETALLNAAPSATSEYDNRVIFALQIPGGVLKGDVLMVDGAIQANNPHLNGANVMFQGQLLLADNPHSVVDAPPHAHRMAGPLAYNITPDTHEGALQRSLSYKVYYDMPVAWVIFSACCASVHFAYGQVGLNINKGDGQLTVAHFR